MQETTIGSDLSHLQDVNPFADGALIYFSRGWTDVFPTGARGGPRFAKEPIPVGVTGYEGKPVGFQKIKATMGTPAGRRNLAIRMPRHIVCLDVDGYDGKDGFTTLAKAEADLGPLPATYRNSARGIESLNGHRYFRLPADKVIKPSAEEDIVKAYGPHIEVLHHYRRYAVAWPSRNPSYGYAMYRWYDPGGQTMEAPPRVVDIPLLPDGWLPLFATEPGSPESLRSGGNLRAPRPAAESDDAVAMFDDVRQTIRRSRAEAATFEQVDKVLHMVNGEVNKVLGGAGIWLARMSASGLLALPDAREVLFAAARRNGVHSDSWNVANRKSWTLASRIDDAISQGLNREPYQIIGDHEPIDVAAALMREIGR
jgi:hypothetical protein